MGAKILQNAGVPAAGTSEVQTLTIGGTPTGGTFVLKYNEQRTAAITWSATNATLLANINAAIRALDFFGNSTAITAAADSLTAGIGTISLTAGGNVGKRALGTAFTVADNSLTGTAPTLAVAITTAGVNATQRGAGIGSILSDTTNGIAYINTGTALAPTWTKIGTQT